MNYIFLLCSERSGSNLITQIFNSHSQCLGKSPSHLYRLFLPIIESYDSLVENKNWHRLIKDVCKAHELKLGNDWKTKVSYNDILNAVQERSVESVIEYIYEKEARATNKNVIFIKEVQAYSFFDQLVSRYPEAKFVYQSRDPRDMALSWSRSPIHRGDIIRATGVWKKDSEHIMNLCLTKKHEHKIISYKYENLLQEPTQVLKSICSFLNINFEEPMLSFYNNMDQLASATDNWKNLNQALLSKNFQKYRSNLSIDQIQYIEYLCHSLMEKLEYTLEYNILTAEGFTKAKVSLESIERHDKDEYANVPEKEKEKREKWMAFYRKLRPE